MLVAANIHTYSCLGKGGKPQPPPKRKTASAIKYVVQLISKSEKPTHRRALQGNKRPKVVIEYEEEKEREAKAVRDW